MTNVIRNVMTVIILAALLSGSRVATGQMDLSGLISGAGGVDEAVELITETLEDQGYDVVLVVDHAAAAKGIGQDLRDTQVVFARPKRVIERSILSRGPFVGIDLPLKFLVFEDENGAIQLSYNPVGYLLDRHDLLVFDPLVWVLEDDLEQFGELDNGLVTIESERSYNDTIRALEDAISANEAFAIPLVQEFVTVFAGPNRTRKATVIVFGNPNAGTPLIQASQEIAIDLPQKFLVRRTGTGKVTITYNDPFFIADRHCVEGFDTLLGNISNALQSFAEQGAGIE